MAQVQCPNCGGFKVETKATVKIDPESGHQVIEGAKSCLLLLLVFLVGPLVALFFGALSFAALASGDPISAIFYGVFGIIGLVPTIVMTVEIIKTIKRGGIKKGRKTVKKVLLRLLFVRLRMEPQRG